MKPSVYILRDSTGRLYVGSTSNLNRRLLQHQSGHTQTTRRMVAPQLVFSQEFASLSEARAIERKLKSWKRKDFLEKIISDGSIKTTPCPRRPTDRT
ncbi:MAG: GIY-YIG nuclease family protein [Patescibacteria group bacterium]